MISNFVNFLIVFKNLINFTYIFDENQQFKYLNFSNIIDISQHCQKISLPLNQSMKSHNWIKISWHRPLMAQQVFL